MSCNKTSKETRIHLSTARDSLLQTLVDTQAWSKGGVITNHSKKLHTNIRPELIYVVLAFTQIPVLNSYVWNSCLSLTSFLNTLTKRHKTIIGGSWQFGLDSKAFFNTFSFWNNLTLMVIHFLLSCDTLP